MLRYTVISLVAAAILPIAVSNAVLQTRASSDGVYLTYCWEETNNTWTSQFPYYANALTGSQNGELPDDNTFAADSIAIWEGNRICATYADTGVQFCSSIVADANSYAVGQFAGAGANEYAGFNCFKDNGRQLFQKKDPATSLTTQCFSRYYCFQEDQS
ncbi:hypothetical protein FE257_007791 [Aspergillus nanangensis]|uniref:Uncharacterized protein n=1 Tax=Aspergillus nanangensis TaxID=2582783 RepID=A0AAD4CYS6_ASPNN|nr:hypothetical protein FE257_007791 [Aspergillus nanangensis]